MKQQRNTRQRGMVLEAVTNSGCEHPSAEDIYMQVRQQDAHVSRGTVYRNLNLLSESGAIARLHLPGAERFDWRTERHAHLVCTRCGSLRDTLLPYETQLDEAVSAQSGFAGVAHRVIFEGICPVCRKDAEK